MKYCYTIALIVLFVISISLGCSTSEQQTPSAQAVQEESHEGHDHSEHDRHDHSGQHAPPPAKMIAGTVIETMNSGGYTYVHVDTGDKKVWAAGPEISVAVGDSVKMPAVMLMKDFRSKNVDAVILDLRRNGGGSLTEAINLTGLFIDEGPVVQVKDSANRIQHYDDLEEGTEWSGPLVVLTSKFSASASEILAGAIQDYRRGIVVGDEATHGKGTVQVIMNLDDNLTLRNMRQYMPLGALKMTTQKFYRVSGDSTQYRGVVPDIILPDRNQYNEFGERYLDYSLKWDRIEEVEHRDWPTFDREDLRAKSHARVAASEEFAEIQKIADSLGERIKDTRQSLLINDVFKEREELLGMNGNGHGMADIDAEDDADQEDTDDDEQNPQ